MKFHAMQWSHQGSRSEQQDACGLVENPNKGTFLAVVCDGAGGHRGGSRASQKMVETLTTLFQQHDGVWSDPAKLMRTAIEEAYQQIVSWGETPKLSPRTTLTALYLEKDKAFWGYIGDSRIYRFHEGRIAERTRDHSMVQILLDQGEVKEDEMGVHPDQGRLLRAIGGEEPPRPVFGSSPITDGDLFLLCTDGFWERIRREEIEKLMRSIPTQNSLAALGEAAVQRNGPKGDNVTVACVRCQGSPTQRTGGARPIIGIFLLVIACALASTLFFPALVDKIGTFLPSAPSDEIMPPLGKKKVKAESEESASAPQKRMTPLPEASVIPASEPPPVPPATAPQKQPAPASEPAPSAPQSAIPDTSVTPSEQLNESKGETELPKKPETTAPTHPAPLPEK